MDFKTQEELLALGLQAVPPGFDKTENSFIHQLISAAAIIGHELMIQAQFLYDNQFADNWSGTVLDRRVYDATGIVRKPAIPATGTVRFTGTIGTHIPQRTVVTDGERFFVTMFGDYITESGTVDIAIQAQSAGDLGFVAGGAIKQLGRQINGVATVTNPEAIHNGRDVESDEALRKRYFAYYSDNAATNNPAQFRAWAKEVSGVGQARVIRAEAQTGLVRLVLLDDFFKPAGTELVDEVKAHIETRMGFDIRALEVVPATEKKVNLTVTVRLNEALTTKEQVQADMEAAIEKDLAFYPDPSFIKKSINKYYFVALVQGVHGVEEIVNLNWNYDPLTVVPLELSEIPVLNAVEVIAE